MPSAHVTVPSGTKPRDVDTMLPLYQRHFGVKYDYRSRSRQVTLTGEQRGVDDASSALRAAFAKLELRTLDSSSSRVSYAQPSSFRCDFFFSATAASSRSWQFKPLTKTLSDANINRFPFELVAVADPDARARATAPTERTDMSIIANRFLVDFDDAYVEAAADLLSQHPQSSSLFVRAVFGRKLFRVMGHRDAEAAVFSFAELLEKHRARSMQSMWSNVCDDEVPRMSALIKDIEAAARRMQVTEPTEQVTVHLKLSGANGRVVARFERDPSVGAGDDGSAAAWKLVYCVVKTGNRVAHDIILHDGVSFRVRAADDTPPSDSALERVRRCVAITEPKDASDVFSARVRVLDDANSDAAAEDAGVEIEWVSVKTELPVPFEGLLFTLVRLRDEVQLEAELPESEENGGDGDSGVAATEAGDRFRLLIGRLLSVLGRY